MILLISLIAVAVVLLVIAFKLEDKHTVIKVLALFFAVYCVLLIGKNAVTNSQICSIEINSTNTTGNITTYEYGRYCFQDDNYNTSNTFYKLTLWFFRLLIVYLIGFFIYLAATYLQEVNNLKKV